MKSGYKLYNEEKQLVTGAENVIVNPESGIIVLSCKLGILSSNPTVWRYLGQTLMPGEKLSLDRVFHKADLDRVQAVIQNVLLIGKTYRNLSGHLVNLKGETVPIQFSVHPLFKENKTVSGFVISFIPMPSLSSRESGMSYQSLFEDLPEGMFTVNNQWQITYFNKRAEQITGFVRDQVINRFCWDVFRSDLCKNGCPLSESFETGKLQTEREVTITNQQGCAQMLIVNTNLLLSREGFVIGAVETFRHSEPFKYTQIGKDASFKGMIANSAVMRSIFGKLPEISKSEASVLIAGESGTGKELVAKAIHDLSGNRNGPFVAINCAAFAESLLESELFGHEKGSFTGADRIKIGRFELAKGGTLFLDEIGELKPELQVKLLRAIEQRLFERVGGVRPILLEARIVSATNQNLSKAMKEHRFREDLYYRLRTIPITLPPLRERPDDIPLLADHFIIKFNDRYHKKVRAVDPKVMRMFMKYPWPGNVRELERCMEHAFVFVKGPVIFSHYLPEFQDYFQPDATFEAEISPFKDKTSVIQALTRTGGNRQNAAELLGISRTSLWRRMKAFGIS